MGHFFQSNDFQKGDSGLPCPLALKYLREYWGFACRTRDCGAHSHNGSESAPRVKKYVRMTVKRGTGQGDKKESLAGCAHTVRTEAHRDPRNSRPTKTSTNGVRMYMNSFTV